MHEGWATICSNEKKKKKKRRAAVGAVEEIIPPAAKETSLTDRWVQSSILFAFQLTISKWKNRRF